MDGVYQFLAVVGWAFALSCLVVMVCQVGAWVAGVSAAKREYAAAKAELAALDTADRVVRPFVQGLAHFLHNPGHPRRVIYNPRAPGLQVAFRSTTHPVVMIFLDRDGLPLGAAAADGHDTILGGRPPEVFTKAERRLLADYVHPYLVETPTPSQAERILRAVADDLAAGDDALADEDDDFEAAYEGE